jgi:hypothetical protein
VGAGALIDDEPCPREVVNGLCHGLTDGNGFGCARGRLMMSHVRVRLVNGGA